MEFDELLEGRIVFSLLLDVGSTLLLELGVVSLELDVAASELDGPS